jgi:ferrous iron transport protein B
MTQQEINSNTCIQNDIVQQNNSGTTGTDFERKNSPVVNKKPSLLLIGNPNVGKSAIFGLLTGKYVVVSNYPGTTVEITRGNLNLNNRTLEVIDTPGIANLLPMSADEMVTRDIMLEEENSSVLQVADAKNLARALHISLQLAEMEVPFTLALNMADEARERRIFIDHGKLSRTLGVDVISTVAICRLGIDKLRKSIENPKKSNYFLKYDSKIEKAIDDIIPLLPVMQVSGRSIALMVLAEDHSIFKYLNNKLSKEDIEKIYVIIRDLRSHYNEPLSYIINNQRMKQVNEIVDNTAVFEDPPRKGIAYNIGRISMHPFWGYPILAAVLVVMYLFVGLFAAGTMVDFLGDVVFEGYIIPWISGIIQILIPFTLVQELLVGEYGILSMGLTYAIAIVLPIVTAFFFFFGILEDSGYLPRLAIMANKAFRYMGLNGKAILPMVLGLGCGTMAAISARILDTKKERLLVILLLSLGIPCSAQLGVIMGLIAGISPVAFIIWLAVIGGSIMLVGYAANKVLPGDNSDFILEIPPLRIPNLKNLAIKTLARMEWYLKEAVPLFIIATFFLFLIDKFQVLSYIEQAVSPVIVELLGLPIKTTEAFLIGFLRRDYGAAGLLDMTRMGLLTNNQILVAMVTITLFIPCIAQFFVIIKEKGWKTALGVGIFVFFYAFIAGGALNFLLKTAGVNL